MNDTSPAVTSPVTRDAPRTFSERGVSVPFTSSELLWARVRQNGPVKELLVPGLAKTRGIFVYQWSTIQNRFSLSLHDRLLAKEISIGPTPTPEMVAATMHRVTGSGAAGAARKADTEETIRQTNAASLHLRLHLTQRVAERGGGGTRITMEDLASSAGVRKTTDALAAVAHVYGLTGPALYNRIESLAGTLAPVGVTGLPVEAPSRRLTQRLNDLSRALTAWADKGAQSGDVEARLVGRIAAEAARLAGAELAKVDAEIQRLDLLLTEWTERSAALQAAAERVHWILDGWERFLRVWQNAASAGDPEAQKQALVLMSYAMPMIPDAELDTTERATWDQMGSELTKIIAAHQEGIDLKAALELLKPEEGADGELPGVPRRRGLSPDKLTQIVRILEPASDRPDGAPAATMLSELRAQITQTRPPRARRPRRVICEVFEELLIDGETSGKIVSRIPRSVIMPAWTLFMERVDKARFADLENRLDQPQNAAALYNLFVNTLKPELDEAAAFTSKSRALIVRLGGEAHYHALENMLGAVTVAQPLTRLRAALPPAPIGDFSDEDLDRIAPILNDVRKANPNQIQTALSVVMARMAEPWAMARLLETLATTGRFRSSAGITGFVATAMIGQLEGRVQDVRKLVEGPESTPAPDRIGEVAMALVESLEDCARTVAGTTATLNVSGTPSQVEEVGTMRDKVRALIDSKLGGSAAESLVAAFTGAPAVRSEAGGVRPGARWRFDQPLDTQTLHNAEMFARALRRVQDNAAVLGLGEKISTGVRQTLEEFEKVSQVLFGQMRTANLDRVQREHARGHAAGIAHVVEILGGSERAERLLAKGHEAIG